MNHYKETIMKKLLALVIAAAFAVPAFAADEAPKTKQVCIDVQGKDGKPVIDPKTKKPKQDCKTVKVHKKHEGTAVPEKKK
jgi:azurin